MAAVDGVNFDAGSGEFVTILGPSGCGKTTLLRMLAGFIAPSAGSIQLNGEPVERLPPQRRAIGMVFQRLALFPHMTAAQNVAYPLKMRRFAPAEIPQRVAHYLSLVKLDGLTERYPRELSGGQQQRVAIARALVFEPDLLLLDEPLSALDKKLREQLQLEFRRIQQDLGVTTVNVTHDQREALVMSDQIVVMEHGVVQQAEPPEQLYRAPANRFVAGFIGLTSFLPGVANGDGGLCVGDMTLYGRASGVAPAAGRRVDGAVRAERVRLSAVGVAASDKRINRTDGIVRARVFEGDRVVYEVTCPALNDALVYAFDHDPERPERRFEPGAAVMLAWSADDFLLFEQTDKH